MHTYQGRKTRFHYNSDFSGKVIIHDLESGAEMEVLAEDVAEFIMTEFVKRRLISLLENLNLADALRYGVIREEQTFAWRHLPEDHRAE